MKQVDEGTDQYIAEVLDRVREDLLHARRAARACGADPDEVIEEVKRIEHERDVEHARMSLNAALQAFKLAARQLAIAYENELIDPMALSDTWPCWMPSIETVAADVEGIEPLAEMPK